MNVFKTADDASLVRETSDKILVSDYWLWKDSFRYAVKVFKKQFLEWQMLIIWTQFFCNYLFDSTQLFLNICLSKFY